MITLITPTGDRLVSLSLCLDTLGVFLRDLKEEVQWIFADDGKTTETSTVLTTHDWVFEKANIDVIAINNKPSDGIRNSNLAKNLLSTVECIKGDQILIIEDDDWYGHDYITAVLHFLESYDVTGLATPVYYNYFDSSYLLRDRKLHASLCNTAFNRCCLDVFKETLEKMSNSNQLLDVRLWKAFREAGFRWKLFYAPETLFIAMKGLPGRKGIGLGHTPNNKFEKDVGKEKLKEWMDPYSFNLYSRLDKLNV